MALLLDIESYSGREPKQHGIVFTWNNICRGCHKELNMKNKDSSKHLLGHWIYKMSRDKDAHDNYNIFGLYSLICLRTWAWLLGFLKPGAQRRLANVRDNCFDVSSNIYYESFLIGHLLWKLKPDLPTLVLFHSGKSSIWKIKHLWTEM